MYPLVSVVRFSDSSKFQKPRIYLEANVTALSASSTSWFARGDVMLCGETSRPRTSSTSWFAVGVVIETGVGGVGEGIVLNREPNINSR